MPNAWKKIMVEKSSNYLDGPIHSMSEFFETGIENLEKSIPSSVPSRNSKTKKRKGPRKLKLQPSTMQRMRTQMRNMRANNFASFIAHAGILQISALPKKL